MLNLAWLLSNCKLISLPSRRKKKKSTPIAEQLNKTSIINTKYPQSFKTPSVEVSLALNTTFSYISDI